MGLSDSIIRQALSDNSGEQLVMQEINRLAKIESEKQGLLKDPEKIDKLAASMAENFSPVVMKGKNVSKFNSAAEGVDSNIPEDHPFAGIGREMKMRLQSALQDPQYKGQTVGKIVQDVGNQYLFEPSGEKGRARLEQAFMYKREKDAELKVGLNPFSEDSSLRKLPGYEQWHEQVTAAEDKNLASESWFASRKDLGEAALWGGGIGAVIGAFTGPATAAVEAGIGAVASPIIEAIAHPVRRAIQGSEWYRSKISSDSTFEGLKAKAFELGTDIGLGFVGWGAGAKAVRVGLRTAAEAGKITEESVSTFLKTGKALDAVKAGEAIFLEKKAVEKSNSILENIARDDVYESAAEAVSAAMKARGVQAAEAEAQKIADIGRQALSGKRQSFVQLLDNIKAQRVVEAPVAGIVKETVKEVKKTPKAMFSELTNDGAEKALNTASHTGDLDSAITKVYSEEAVVKDVVKKEASDYIELLTGKEKAGKQIFTTDRARATLQAAGYDTEDIASMERRKLIRLANSIEEKKKSSVPKEVSKEVQVDSTLPTELSPEAQGIGRQVSAEEAVAQSDQEVSKMVSDSETTGYLEAMLESGKLKAEQLTHEGPITSSSAIDLPAAERAVPQEALIEDFIYNKMEEQFAKKYGDQFWHWTSPEVYPDVVPDPKVQKEIQSVYEFLQKKYGYDLKAMVPSKQKAILKYGVKEGHEAVSFDEEVKKIRSFFDGKNIIGPLGVAIIAGLAIPVSGLLGPKEAEAAGFDSVGRAVPKVLAGLVKKVAGASEEAKIAMMKSIREAEYIPGEIAQGQKTVPLDYFGRQMHIAADAKAAGVKASEMVARKKGLFLGVHNVMSPTGIANIAYKDGYSVAVQRGHLQTLWAVHTRDVMRVVDNILGDTKSNASEIAKMTAPFIDDYAVVQASRAMESRLDSMNKAIDRLYKRSTGKKVGPKTLEELDNSITKAELGRDLLKKEVDRLAPQVEAFNNKFSAVEQEIARKFPSARIFYAAEDTSDFTIRPWLRGMVSYDEQVKAGHIKNLMDTYALRMLEGHHKVITDAPYMHHAFHPKYSDAKAKEFLDSVGINVNPNGAFLKFFKRNKYSRAFIPDVRFTLEKYIPDAEKRILVSDFWRKTGPKEYRQSGWYSHMRTPTVQFNKMLSGFWNRMYSADEPEMRTVGNRLANWYTAFETAALIGFSPATAFKHVFKNLGTWGQLGLSESLSHVPEAVGTASRNWLNSGTVQDGVLMSGLRKLGFDTVKSPKVLDKFADAMTHQYKMLHHMADMQLPDMTPSIANKIDQVLYNFNKKGSVLISGVEAFDRAHSFHAALDLATNKGMTAKQAAYGIFDTILKNNFLGGGLNPGWMKKPAVRALFLFQNTPFKIMERRLVNGIKTYQNVKTAIGVIKKQDLRKTLEELRGLGRYIKSGADELKNNLIRDALFADKDVFGTPVTKQFMREFIYTGLTIYGLGSLFNADFVPHTLHVPFLSTFGGDKPQLGVSPLVGAIYKGLHRKRESVDENGQEVGWVSEFLQDWLGKKQFIPQTFYKLNRISENDIPEVYKGSKFRYLFSVPTRE